MNMPDQSGQSIEDVQRIDHSDQLLAAAAVPQLAQGSSSSFGSIALCCQYHATKHSRRETTVVVIARTSSMTRSPVLLPSISGSLSCLSAPSSSSTTSKSPASLMFPTTPLRLCVAWHAWCGGAAGRAGLCGRGRGRGRRGSRGVGQEGARASRDFTRSSGKGWFCTEAMYFGTSSATNAAWR